METKCNTTLYLQEIASADGQSAPNDLASVAQSALRIISDVAEYRLTSMDVDCLEWLLASLVQHGHAHLLSHIQTSDADCEICAALAQRMQTPKFQESLAG